MKEEFAPGYYQQISRPMDLGTVLGEARRVPARPRPAGPPAGAGLWQSCCDLHRWRLLPEGWLPSRAEQTARVLPQCPPSEPRCKLEAGCLLVHAAAPPATHCAPAPCRAADKLTRRAYESVYDLQDDVRLVFENCRKYNSEGGRAARSRRGARLPTSGRLGRGGAARAGSRMPAGVGHATSLLCCRAQSWEQGGGWVGASSSCAASMAAGGFTHPPCITAAGRSSCSLGTPA